MEDDGESLQQQLGELYATFGEDDVERRAMFVRRATAIFDRHHESALGEIERRARADAHQAARLRERFLTVMAHELRSPMASILLWGEVLRNPAIDEATRTCALDTIRDGAAGQAKLVADLLEVSRTINGELHIERRVTPLTQVLELAIDDVRPRAEARRLDVSSLLAGDLGDVLGDARRLRQVFDHLLSNAVTSTEQGGVSVMARQTDGEITIVISDTGRGIDPHLLPHVFEPFRQGDVENDIGEGFGLGLAIARQLVEGHDGTISAESAGIGRGATFTVTFPRASAAP